MGLSPLSAGIAQATKKRGAGIVLASAFFARQWACSVSAALLTRYSSLRRILLPQRVPVIATGAVPSGIAP